MAETATIGVASSGVTGDQIKEILIDKLGASHVEMSDLSGGCGQMFDAIIVSPQFEKKMSLARHRIVNATLKTEIAQIHAWSAKCFTPAEWEKKQQESTKS